MRIALMMAADLADQRLSAVAVDAAVAVAVVIVVVDEGFGDLRG